ncbi:hypothetical protein TWF481_002136 [Arthrobotrys musiformis]|uniref:Uncharacterized protein n=1 Tax=Arthrobotrys musiformis TaxID=47236 RepID=A0AAV9VU05_9PEZI
MWFSLSMLNYLDERLPSYLAPGEVGWFLFGFSRLASFFFSFPLFLYHIPPTHLFSSPTLSLKNLWKGWSSILEVSSRLCPFVSKHGCIHAAMPHVKPFSLSE